MPVDSPENSDATTRKLPNVRFSQRAALAFCQTLQRFVNGLRDERHAAKIANSGILRAAYKARWPIRQSDRRQSRGAG